MPPKKKNNGSKRDEAKSPSNADFAMKVVKAMLKIAQTKAYSPGENFKDRGFSGLVCRELERDHTEKSWKGNPKNHEDSWIIGRHGQIVRTIGR